MRSRKPHDISEPGNCQGLANLEGALADKNCPREDWWYIKGQVVFA